MNAGVYVAAGPNPIFFRLFMCQLARQTRLPEYLSIIENGNKTSAYPWCCKDVVEDLQKRGVTIFHRHVPEVLSSIVRYHEALHQLLQNSPVEIVLKMDLDDFYEDHYIENMVDMLGRNDWAINLNSGLVLVRPYAGDFKYKSTAVMKHSPVGAAPTHCVFNRAFANTYSGFLAGCRDRMDLADDELMAEAMAGMKIARIDGPTDYMYVSHGSNHSSASWQSTGGRIYFDN